MKLTLQNKQRDRVRERERENQSILPNFNETISMQQKSNKINCLSRENHERG